ncbi:MAG: Gfo/Idh/MocA family oxidoreductase [Armatimonadetes bacterium]|nr:Gfo/Idh/MocA family oxidoreductase [Armatimonadota bacterium]MDW8122465.1 Gfo/Idh/MocA family oxidoreductase [Armatimonadota bacterium]
MRVGFIGCGGIAGLHINNLSRLEGVELKAFCDVDEARAKSCAERFSGRWYTDHHRMMENEELDAVYVCIPPAAHTDQEILVAQRGWALFVEKPVARDIGTAKKVLSEIQKAGIINSVGYHFRYMDGTDRMKERLEGKTIGMVLGYWMGGLPGVPWWRRLALSGGQLVEQTTHIFDLARFVVGEIIKVSGATALRALQHVPDLDVPDVGTVLCWFDNGAIGMVANTCLLQMGYTTGLHVITPDLIAELSWSGVKFLSPGKVEEIRHQRDGHYYESVVFIQAVRNKDQSMIRSDYADAVKTLAVTLAAVESADKGGEPVTLTAD